MKRLDVLLWTPASDGNFKAALQAALIGELQTAIKFCRPKGDIVRKSKLEARLRQLGVDPDAPQPEIGDKVEERQMGGAL